MRGREFVSSTIFGGFLLQGANAREKRPFQKDKRLLVSLVADETRMKTVFFNPKGRRVVTLLLRRQSRAQRVKIFDVRLSRNEIQIELQTKSRQHFNNFLRALTGLMGRTFLGRERGPARIKSSRDFQSYQKQKRKLWRCRPLTVILTSKCNWLRRIRRLNEELLQKTGDSAGLSTTTVALPLTYFSSA